jgi:hypothetical protein
MARQGSLDQARIAAMLSKPHVLPPKGQRPDAELPKNFQSLGSRGISILTGRLLLAIYPPSVPWFVLVPAARIRNDPDHDQQQLQATQQNLFLYASTLMAQLESTEVDPDTELRRRLLGFRSHKARTIEQILITGDSLERLHPDYRMQLFRRDGYVTQRDSGGAVLYHVTKERFDVKELTPDLFAATKLPAEMRADDDPRKRQTDVYTWCQWQPQASNWLIKQEINGNIVVTSEEKVSPYISTPFELVGENYGRGFIESQNLGDLRSLDELEMRRLDILALAGKGLLGIDQGSNIRTDDLMQGTGHIVEGCRLVNGVVQDVGPIAFTHGRDFAMLTAGVQDKRQDLAKSMLIEGDTTRQAERVTTVEIQRNVQELQSALGGVYASVADEQQLPLLQRLIWQYNKDHNQDIPRGADRKSLVEVRSLTGLAALSNSQDIQKLLTALQLLQQLGPEAMARVNIGVAVDILLRQVGIHEPGLIKTDEEVRREQQQLLQQQVAAQAAGQAVASSGKIAEEQAKVEAQGQEREQREAT